MEKFRERVAAWGIRVVLWLTSTTLIDDDLNTITVDAWNIYVKNKLQRVADEAGDELDEL
jgi:hypothetical protein